MALGLVKKTSLLVSILTPLLSWAANAQRSDVKIRVTINEGKILTATMMDNEASRDFLSLLPLTVTMDDLFGREKYGPIPKKLSNKPDKSYRYEVGQIGYWSPGPDVAIYYRQDGETIPSPGIVVIGRIDSGIEAFNVPGSVQVKIALSK